MKINKALSIGKISMAPLSFLSYLILLSSGKSASGFTSNPGCNGHCRPVLKSASTQLFGITEWRDLPSGMTYNGDEHDEAADTLKYGTSARRVPVMQISPDEIVLPGEKKYVQFHSDDELRLFQRALDRNHGIFAMGAIIGEDEDGDDIMMSKIQLMEIKEYNMDLGGNFGIFCTAQAVGRATLFAVLNDKLGTSVDGLNVIAEPLIAICEEHFDHQESYYSMEDANEMAKGVLEIVANLSNKEEECTKKGRNNVHDGKIIHGVDNEGEDCDDFEDTRKDRFAQAFFDSLESDSHGYISKSPTGDGMLSWKEMNAISWGAFCTSLNPSEDETYRLHALDQDRITDRLKLATYWLSDVVQEVEQESNLR